MENLQIKPGLFGESVAADSRRLDFDYSNEQLLYLDKEIDYLFLGDSITHFWNLNVYFKTDKFLENRGIGGDVSKYLLKRFDADCIQLKPKCAVIMIGANDIFRTEDDLWYKTVGEDCQIVMEDYKKNISAMIEKCDNAGIEVVLCSVLPSTIAPPFNRERRWEMTKLMNNYLKSFNRKYVDYHSALTADGHSLPEELSLDGIHPNAKAYSIMAEVLKKTIDL